MVATPRTFSGLRPRQNGESFGRELGIRPVFAIAAVGVAELVGATAVADSRVPIDVLDLPDREIDEPAERSLLGGKNRPGRLIELHASKGSMTSVLTIHGINGSPEGFAPLHDPAHSRGDGVLTFVYDDNYRRLDKSADDFAKAISDWQTAHPFDRLVIDAHSMGGRVALAGLGRLSAGPGIHRPIELNLIASPLGGYESANGARHAPKFMRGWIKNLRPSRDMGTKSEFQKELERVSLPSNVVVRIFVAGADEVVGPHSAAPPKIVNRLGAEVLHLDGSSHNGAIAAAAAMLTLSP